MAIDFDERGAWNQPNNVDAVQRISVTALPGTIYVGDPPW
jgi:hypothetical protein